MSMLGYKPKYALIADMVRERILSGRFSKGDKLLPDDELALTYEVSKQTVANGLNVLVEEGLLDRAPGRGTIVIADPREGMEVSNAVGLVMMSRGDVYSDICGSISQALLERNLYPVLINQTVLRESKPDNANRRVVDFLEQLFSSSSHPYGLIVDGDLAFPYGHIKSAGDIYRNTVFITKYHHPERITPGKYALVDFRGAGGMAARYLIGQGHRKLACLACHERYYAGPWSSMQVMIMQGFAEACRAERVAFQEDIFWKLLHGAPFRETVTEFLAGKDRPDAFFYYRDHAVRSGILPILEDLGLAYPKDIEFVGFYDTPHAKECGFSSIRIREDRIADAAVRLLTGEADEQEILIHSELVVRTGSENPQPEPVGREERNT